MKTRHGEAPAPAPVINITNNFYPAPPPKPPGKWPLLLLPIASVLGKVGGWIHDHWPHF